MSKISKLGLGIVAFEGTEHIKNITYEIRDLCDYIVICLQEISYDGSIHISQDDIDECNHLLECKLIDDIIWFEPKDMHEDAKDKNAVPRMIETDKRNFILDYLQSKECSHALIIDSDEFYNHDDFKNAKNVINVNEQMVVTYCEYINYYRDYEHILVWPFHSYVPFVSEIKYRFSFDRGSFDRPSDPTRRYAIPDKGMYHIFPYNVIKMHHLSWIRINIEKKIASWSAKKYFANEKNLEENILNRYYNYQDGMNAFITFNVPGFQVAVNRLPKRYITPKYILHERAESYESRSIDNDNRK